ncbi:MAG TPA: AAA domain-containing protein, partial [Candidatus Omnitrophota bacterium]|nr:AAA domain-containing protein [Candidatus Omnitrophota bacterium]
MVGKDYELTLNEEPSGIKAGDTLYVEDSPFVLNVLRTSRRAILVSEDSASGQTLFSKGAVIHSPINPTFSVQKNILERIIDNFEKSDLRTTGFNAIDRLLRLSKDTSVTRLDGAVQRQYFDPNIPRRMVKNEDGEDVWVGDQSQEVALEIALSDSKLKIIHGPPGTGKTTVIAEAVRHLVKNGKRVLLVSQMNQAVDNVLSGIMNDADTPVLRIGNSEEQVTKNGTRSVWIHNETAVADFERKCARSGRGFIFAATDTGIATDKTTKRWLREKEFDVVIMDEASRENLTGAFVPLQYLKDDGRIILVGDTKQLKPFMTIDQEKSLLADGFTREEIGAFASSVLSEAEGTNIADEVLLSTNWRSHPLISGLVSRVFYKGAIHRRGWEDFTPDTLSLKILDIGAEAEEYFEERVGDSYQNSRSAEEVMDLLAYHIRDRKVRPEDITVITAYKPQEELLSRLTLAKYGPASPKITTIDNYQGGENDTIIIDFVRSNKKGAIGFLKDVNRLNVALSRAKESLSIVWDSRVFMRDPAKIAPGDLEARDVLRRIREYYIKEVWQFFPEDLGPMSTGGPGAPPSRHRNARVMPPITSVIALIAPAALYALYYAWHGFVVNSIGPALPGAFVPIAANAGGWLGLWLVASILLTHSATQSDGENPPLHDMHSGKVVVIGGSAFGWNAISRIVDDLPAHHPPVIIAEHIPASENREAAELARRYPGRVLVYENGIDGKTGDITLMPNTILMAKYNAVVGMSPEGYPIVRLYPDMVESFREDGGHHYMCIDRLFTSAAEHFGNGAVGVIVSGRFVDDGLEGGRAIVNGGGSLLIQAMPQSLISATLPMLPEIVAKEVHGSKNIDINDLASEIMRHSSRRGSGGSEPEIPPGHTPILKSIAILAGASI